MLSAEYIAATLRVSLCPYAAIVFTGEGYCKPATGTLDATKAVDKRPFTLADLNVSKDVLDEASDILKPFTELLPVKVLEETLYLPENNSLWRGLQFWGLVKHEVSIDFGLFCLAGTCKNCGALLKLPGSPEYTKELLCQTTAVEGVHIKKLPRGFELRKKRSY